MRILIGCEESGVLRRLFRESGHDAYSCDLIDSRDNSEFHLKCDLLSVLDQEWDMIIAHPPCTFVTNTAARWLYDSRYPTRQQDALDSIKFIDTIWNAPIQKKCVENPIGMLSTKWKKPTQIVQPFHFGDDASKATCLWLDNLPKLIPTNIVDVTYITTTTGKRFSKWYWDTSCLPLKDRARVRSETFLGIGRAMVNQWGMDGVD